MKRAALILFAVLLLLACGCGAQTEETPAGSATASPSQPAASVATVASAAPTVSPTSIATTEPEPTATPAAVLSEGAQSEAVTTLQQRLIGLGYLQDGADTGYYGEKTKQAVRLFQKQNGLAQDGIAGNDVLSLVYADDAKECVLPLAGCVIGLDPGHQSKGNSEQEPVAPGSSETKKKVSSGTQGTWSRVPEYQVNLDVALLLRDLLEAQGATVIMTRQTNDVNISNIERAELFNDNKTDYALRLHCNGSDDPDKHGAFMLVPAENPYLDDCKTAAQLLIDAYCKETGAKNLGITARSDQTGFNWCSRMIINIEMGHMTNQQEDALLASSDYQKKMAQGLFDGILAYFAQRNG